MDIAPTLKNLEQTLADVKQIDPAKARNIITNYDEFIHEFQQVVKAKSVSSLLGKAKQYYFNEKEILEMNLLFSAYCKIKASNLNNEDLATANLVDYTTGDTLTLEGIEQRLMALGWLG